MSKKKNPKRKAQLNEKALIESFKFQVTWEKKHRLPEITDETLNAELNALCEKGLTETMLTLQAIVKGVREELGYKTETGKGSLEGAIVPFLLDITTTLPNTAQPNTALANADSIQLPLQITLYYDNDIRNQVVDWVKSRYETVTTRLGQPILKLANMVVEFKRVVKP